MVLCCCFFVSLKIHSSGLVIRAVSKGRESWALEEAWVVLGRAPVCWQGAVEGQGAVAGQAPMVSGHQGFVPLAQWWHVKGQGCLGFSWTLLQPEQSREASGPSRAAKGTGAASAVIHTLLPPGMPSTLQGCSHSHQQGAPGPASSEAARLQHSLTALTHGFLSPWAWSKVPQTSLRQLVSAAPFAEGLTDPRACLGSLTVWVWNGTRESVLPWWSKGHDKRVFSFLPF